jgi:hypothetical protein
VVCLEVGEECDPGRAGIKAETHAVGVVASLAQGKFSALVISGEALCYAVMGHKSRGELEVCSGISRTLDVVLLAAVAATIQNSWHLF